ncbi:Glycosyl hydrolases family 43 [Eubacterium ruminantium]|uniref:Glycosyl hydrolases family 43 n=1 Tax=Eubacterium ruminantium TaxID=42322 RepID=A0A1T4K5Z8_9FIRM|nr:glycoside hydrolase family 43 protein [Eubacterium ruminantium]SCW27435.1 Glycosyl hydrolases family 43 [Eubacterium ruminantium]SDM14907.1 Glycosyl hydrolases family 43 [Eubacterium ruminantium]SJZ37831.1 Glycosyl hydrolases family 43 [Eubacterium ruminantium]
MRKNERKPLVTNIYTADPSAHVFDGKIYIYPSHDFDWDCPEDDDGEQYKMEDYHILSMDNLDSKCVDNGVALHEKDVPWVGRQLWAPDAVKVNGKYYLVFPAKDKDEIFRIGVAESDSPVGPFKPQENYIQGSYSIDPAVLLDDDGRIYCYNGGLWGGQLEMWQSGKFNPDERRPEGKDKSLGPLFAEFTQDMTAFKEAPKMIEILDENGDPITAGDEDRRYFEDPWMHKFNGKYYLSYSTGTTHYLVYAEGDNPAGPFTYKGRIMEPVIGWTTHHSIVQIDGDWYLFYHDAELSKGISHKRCVKYTKLTINEDGTIETIIPYDHEK